MKESGLVVYASFGEGHKKAALALRDIPHYFCKDLLDFCPPFIKKVYSASYIFVTDYLPFLWKVIFRLSKKKLIKHIIDKVHALLFNSFFAYLEEIKPHVVIATHFFPIFLSKLIKKKLNFKLVVIVTDLIAHPLWMDEFVDYYFVGLEETKQDLVVLGVEREKIIRGAVSLRAGFWEDTSKEVIRKKLELPIKPTLLFVSSSRGKFPYLKEIIYCLKDNFNILVICGKNRRLKSYLGKLNYSSLRIFSFYEEMWELVSLASVIITKPGGITILEGICKKKFFIFTHYIPGQEKGNMDLLINYGIGRFVRNKDQLLESIDYFLTKGEKLKESYPVNLFDIRPLLGKVHK
jgi:processive 1,2-diacylglycerol beta-glucosyltransferase